MGRFVGDRTPTDYLSLASVSLGFFTVALVLWQIRYAQDTLDVTSREFRVTVEALDETRRAAGATAKAVDLASRQLRLLWKRPKDGIAYRHRSVRISSSVLWMLWGRRTI
jgi:hypothetical protein